MFVSAEATDELWIGLNDRKTEGLFDWADLSDVRFTSWEYGRPAVSSEMEDCVLMRGAVRRLCGNCTHFTFRFMHMPYTQGGEQQ